MGSSTMESGSACEVIAAARVGWLGVWRGFMNGKKPIAR